MITEIFNKPIYRMSSAGKCARALSAERLNFPAEQVPEWLEIAAREGNKHEEWIKEELTTEGFNIYDEQIEVILEYPAFTLIGHIDGKTRDAGNYRLNNRLLEIKTMSQYEFDRWMKGRFIEFPAYAAQITCYMKATELTGVLYLVKNRSSGYVDKQILIEAPVDFEEIITKLNHIEECVKIGTLVDIEYFSDSLQCRRCNYKNLCIPEPQIFNTVSESQLLKASENWRLGQKLINEGDQLVESAKKVFFNQTEASGQKKWKFDKLTINKIEVKASVTYPKSNLLKIFTEEELKPASEPKLSYSYLKIDDTKEKE